jgi:hypothetical protein
MCRIASLFLLQRLKGSVSGGVRDFNNIETRAIIKYFFPTRQGFEGDSHTYDRNIRGNAPSYDTIKCWVVQFKSGIFSTCYTPRLGRPKTVTTPEIIDQIHELILDDRRISVK